jgi:hypothetical protein
MSALANASAGVVGAVHLATRISVVNAGGARLSGRMPSRLTAQLQMWNASPDQSQPEDRQPLFGLLRTGLDSDVPETQYAEAAQH